MRIYIPFSDGSSISFDGEKFLINKSPKDINSIDNDPSPLPPCMAEKAWETRKNDLIKALENSYRNQTKIKKSHGTKKIYKP